MNPSVQEAIAEIEATFPEHVVETVPDGHGGAYVTVNNVRIGDRFQPSTTWIGFRISFQYPHADVYPHHIDGAVRFANGAGWCAGFSGPINWQGKSAIQVSRSTRQHDPATNTAAIKLSKVLTWLRSQ